MKAYSIVALLALSGANASAQTLCDTPPQERLAQAKSGLRACGLEKVLYRSAGKIVEATLASQPYGWEKHGDSVHMTSLYFLDVPGEGLAALGEFKHRYGATEQRFREQLELTWNEARKSYDVLIERRNDQFCAIYRMKSPYVGELASCPDGVTGTVSRESSQASPD